MIRREPRQLGGRVGPKLVLRWTTCRLVLVEGQVRTDGRRLIVAEGSWLAVARWTAAVEAVWEARVDGGGVGSYADRLVLPLGDPQMRGDGTWDLGWEVTAAYLRTVRTLGVPADMLWRAVVEASGSLLATWSLRAASPSASVQVVGGRVTGDPRFVQAFQRTWLTAASLTATVHPRS